MKHTIDLRNWVGPITVKGATNLHHGLTQERANPVTDPPDKMDTRSLLRFLWSETPFVVTGRKVVEEEHSRPV
jgi:hypothetical protein